MKGASQSPLRSARRKRETTSTTPFRGKAKKKPTESLQLATPLPTRKDMKEHLLSSRLEEPPDRITQQDFKKKSGSNQEDRDTAPCIPFDPHPEWFDSSIGVIVKATFAKPGEQTYHGGVISNGKDEWFFLHSSNLKDLTGPGFMLSVQTLPFLYQNGEYQKPLPNSKQNAKRQNFKWKSQLTHLI